jgi:beta-lactamase regulating signal transducer with metallopeptidase domain
MSSSLLLPLAVKGTLLLGLALLATLLMRRRSAAARHLAWSWSLRALLILPLLAALLPSWRPPATGFLSTGGSARASLVATDATIVGSPTANAVDESSSMLSTPSPRGTVSSHVRLALQQWLLVAWGCVTTGLLVRLALGAIRLRRIARAARALADPRWTASLAEVADTLALTARPRLAVSHDVPGPCVLGILAPAILLPPDAIGWDAPRRRSVLLHELAHVGRRDGLDILVSRIALAAWWFHPLAWLAERRCRIERERACDDAVLLAGSAARSYAQQLLDLASSGGAPIAALSAMAQRSGLEERVRAVLDGRLERRTLHRGVLRPLVILLLTAVVASAGPARPATSGDALVLTIDTGMQPDETAFVKHLGPSARATAGGVTWERHWVDYAALNWPRGLSPHPEGVMGNDWFTSFPSSVTLHFALDPAGRLRVGAAGPLPDVLCVLADGGVSTASGWGEKLPVGRRIAHGLLGLDARSTVLAFLAFGEMLSAAEAGAVHGGPELVTSSIHGSDEGHFLRDFDLLPFRLDNNLGEPITVIQAALFVSQPSTKFAYGGPVDGLAYTEAPWWPVQAALNERWDPWSAPDEDGIRVRRVEMDWGGVDHSFVSARAHGDNGNSGQVMLDGRIVKSFLKWDESSDVVRLPDARPQHVQLALAARWSSCSASIRAVALGGSLAATLADETIEPDRWVIPPS